MEVMFTENEIEERALALRFEGLNSCSPAVSTIGNKRDPKIVEFLNKIRKSFKI
jgi:hypothetical protein